jgi:hypothetical protein
MYNNKAKSFSKFLALAEQFQAANLVNYYKIAYYKQTDYFQAVFFTLADCRHTA